MSDDRLRFDADGSEPAPAKCESAVAPIDTARPPTAVIVKVRRPGYVPPGFAVQSRIDDHLFTARADPDAVLAANSDPDVVSIAAARRLHTEANGSSGDPGT